jgi:hypothetical protein
VTKEGDTGRTLSAIKGGTYIGENVGTVALNLI